MLKLQGGNIPELLRSIPDAPKVLYLEGASINGLLERPRVAVIGTRTVTPYGRGVTESITEELASNGVVIISGLALGVDAIAHRSALKVNGTTVAILPGAVSRVYPRSHELLAQQIVNAGGALLSENHGVNAPRAYDFLHRNRLISALADAVLITEAAVRSGSLNTARHALEQGKTIFAIPGNITSPYSEGTNNLIKMGAILVTSVRDIYSEMGWVFTSKKETTPLVLPQEQMIIYKLLRSGITGGEELLMKSGLQKNAFAEALTMLEIESIIRPLGGNNWSIK